MHLICPHCQSPIELVSLPGTGEVVCGSCGSTFRVESGSTAPWDSEAGRRLGRFDLIAVVGSGAFGTVYRARDLQLDRVVALKVPRAGNLPEGADLDRFVREGRSAGQLRHPSIVAVHEVGQVDGIPFIVSDFVEGVTLADRMTASRPSPREAATIVASVADALDEAHRQGVIHRDIKPSNIMLGLDGLPMVMDFGLAKREAGEVTMTLEGQVLGTPAFMSPEQAGGDAHKVDGRSDIYSLGAVLYLLLTGELPFKGNARMLLHQVLHDNPRSPRSLVRSIPRDLETICLKAMAKSPLDRYPSASDFADDLRRWLTERPVQARPVGPLRRLGLWSRRNPALATAGGLALLAVMVMIVTSTLYLQGKRQASAKLAAADAQRTAALKDVERQKVVASLDRGRVVYRDGQASRALLHAIEGLRLARLAGDTDLEREARTLITIYRTEVHSLQNLIIGAKPFSVPNPLMRDNVIKVERGGLVAFTRDGQSALIASAEGTAQMFDVRSGRSIGPSLKYSNLGEGPIAVAISPDGRTAAFSVILPDPRTKVTIWDLATGKQLSEPATGKPLRATSVRTTVSLAFSPDGKTLATGDNDDDDMPVRRWDMATGKEVGSPLEQPKSDTDMVLKYSPDGRMLASAGRKSIRIWDLASGRMVDYPIPFKETHDLAFREDSSGFIAAGEEARILLGTFVSNPIVKNEYKIRMHDGARILDGPINAVAISPDGHRYLSGSQSGIVRLYADGVGMDGRSRLYEVDGVSTAIGPPMEPIWSLAFVNGGRSIVCGSIAGIVRTWNVAEDYQPRKSWVIEGEPIGLGYGTGDRSLFVTFKNRSQLWDPATGLPLGPPGEFPPAILGATVSPNRSEAILFGLSHERRIGNDDQPRGQVFRQKFGDAPNTTPWIKFDGTLQSPTYIRDDRAVVFRAQSGPYFGRLTFRIHDAETGQLLGEPWNPEQGLIDKFAVDPSGRIALTANNQFRRAQFWDFTANPPTPLGQPLDQPSPISAVAFDPTGTEAATGSRNGVIRLWDVITHQPIGAEMKLHFPVRLLVFSPDGKILLSSSDYEAEARLWDTSTGQPLTPLLRTAGVITGGAFHPNSQTVAICTVNPDGKGTISIWELPIPTSEDVEQLQLRTQVETGLEMSEAGEIRVMKPETWLERKGRLK